MSHHYTARLAEFAAGLRFDDIPQPVVERVKILALDAIGCGLLGAGMPWSRRLVATLDAIETRGAACVWGTDRRFSAPSAAMANATAVHGFELDDVSHGGHHGSVVMTSGMSMADQLGSLGGQDLITAMVAGVETAARVQSCVGRVPQVTLGFHGPGVIGTFGAAACAARLLGLSADQMVHAFGHAAQQTSGLMATQHGGMGKRLLAGKAAHSGTLAALLAAHDFTNVPDIFERSYGGFCSAFTGGADAYDLEQLVKDLGTHWASADLNFKMWACRVPIHPTLEALRGFQLEHGLAPEQIEHVRVVLDEGAYRAVGWAWVPTTPTSAQLNLTYCAAVLLLEGDVFVDQFAGDKLADPRVLDMVGRIEVVHDPELDTFGSFQQRTNVEVELKGGHVLRAAGVLRGIGGTPLTREDIVAKFRKVTRGLLSASSIDELVMTCNGLDTLPNAAELSGLLVTRSAGGVQLTASGG